MSGGYHGNGSQEDSSRRGLDVPEDQQVRGVILRSAVWCLYGDVVWMRVTMEIEKFLNLSFHIWFDDKRSNLTREDAVQLYLSLTPDTKVGVLQSDMLTSDRDKLYVVIHILSSTGGKLSRCIVFSKL